jgi:hypothetical protein
MAGAPATKRRPETMAEFAARRDREQFDRIGGAARAAAHDAIGTLIRAGKDFHLPTADDVLSYGADIVNGGRRKRRQPPAPAARPVAQMTGRPVQLRAPQSAKPVSPPRTTEPQWLDELNRNPYAKGVAGYAGMVSGWVPGASRGVRHTVEGALDAAMFASRAVNPGMDYATSAPGQRVGDQVLDAGMAVAEYANRARKDPGKLSRDVRQFGRQLNVDLNPVATPSADTAVGEFKRLYDVGQNQGELALNIVTLPVGAELAAVSGLGRAASLAKSTRYLREAGRNKAADYLALPYEGMGHHSVVARGDPMPKWLGGGAWPERILESPFNKVNFRHLTKGEAYAKHAMIDDSFYGAKLKRGKGVKGWSAKKAGIETQEGLERIWNGTPEATKDLAGSIVGGFGGLIHEPMDEERPC